MHLSLQRQSFKLYGTVVHAAWRSELGRGIPLGQKWHKVEQGQAQNAIKLFIAQTVRLQLWQAARRQASVPNACHLVSGSSMFGLLDSLCHKSTVLLRQMFCPTLEAKAFKRSVSHDTLAALVQRWIHHSCYMYLLL